MAEESSVKFYNYHEYVLASAPEQLEQLGYTVDTPDGDGSDGATQPVLLTHFENPYTLHPAPSATPDGSTTPSATRIVRIPREFERFGDLVPQFSTAWPGTEPGALVPSNENNQLSSATPLGIFLSPEELAPVVATINLFLREALSPYSVRNVVEALASAVTCWTLELVWEPYTKRRLGDMERYVEQVNEEWAAAGKRVRIVSPLRSGYLSLDVEIPVPGSL